MDDDDYEIVFSYSFFLGESFSLSLQHIKKNNCGGRGIKKKTNKDQKKQIRIKKKQIRTIVVKIVKKLRKGRIKKKTNGNTYE